MFEEFSNQYRNIFNKDSYGATPLPNGKYYRGIYPVYPFPDDERCVNIATANKLLHVLKRHPYQSDIGFPDLGFKINDDLLRGKTATECEKIITQQIFDFIKSKNSEIRKITGGYYGSMVIKDIPFDALTSNDKQVFSIISNSYISLMKDELEIKNADVAENFLKNYMNYPDDHRVVRERYFLLLQIKNLLVKQQQNEHFNDRIEKEQKEKERKHKEYIANLAKEQERKQKEQEERDRKDREFTAIKKKN